MSLETDYTTVPGQAFACLSIVGPECPQKNEKFGIKIRGAFATRDEAAITLSVSKRRMARLIFML